MRCGDCKHFDPAEEDNDFGDCKRVKFAGLDYYAGASEFNDELAVVVDGSSYFAALLTRADFGCVLFDSVPRAGT